MACDGLQSNASSEASHGCAGNSTAALALAVSESPVGNETMLTTEDPQCSMFYVSWYIRIVYMAAFVMMVIVAAGGNIIVIWIVLGHKRMRTVTNYFLVNLAVADAMITIFNTSFNFNYILQSHWPFGSVYCKFSQFIAPCTISASVFTFMAIAIDRYMVIVHPLKPRIQASRVLAVITIIWVSSVAVAFPNLPYAVTHTFPNCIVERTICFLQWPDGSNSPTDLAYNVFLMLVNYVVPLAALAITYTRVGVELWGSQAIGERTANHDETVKSKRKVVKMMVVVVAIFAVCWLPQHVFFVYSNFNKATSDYPMINHIYSVIYWLAMSNSMYNPIIYCWMNARFRSGFKYVLRWLPCVKWRPSDAAGFWGYTSSRNSSTEPTRYSYASQNSNGLASLHLCPKSVIAAGPQSHPVVRHSNSDGSRGVWVFQNRYSCRRLDSG